MKRYTLFLLLLLIPCTAAFAQSEAEEDAATPAPSTAPSLTVGYLNTDFAYAADTTTAYAFDESLYALMLSWQQGSLTLSYGTRAADSTGAQPGDTTAARPELRTIGASLWVGGDVYLFRKFFGVPLSVFVPIRFNASYRYVAVEDTVGAPAGGSGPPTLHLLGSGLGLGGGARFAFPVGPSFLKNNLVLEASYVWAPGVISNVGEDFGIERPEQILNEWKLRWATDLDIELQWKGLLGGKVGVTAGYTLRTASRSAARPESFGDVVDAFLDRGDFVQVTDQHVFRVGINW